MQQRQQKDGPRSPLAKSVTQIVPIQRNMFGGSEKRLNIPKPKDSSNQATFTIKPLTTSFDNQGTIPTETAGEEWCLNGDNNTSNQAGNVKNGIN